MDILSQGRITQHASSAFSSHMRRNTSGLPNKVYLANWSPTDSCTCLTQVGIPLWNCNFSALTWHPNAVGTSVLRGIVGTTQSIALRCFFQSNLSIPTVLLTKGTGKYFNIISRGATGQRTCWMGTIEAAETTSGSPMFSRWIIKTVWTNSISL